MDPSENKIAQISPRLKPILDLIRRRIDKEQTTHEGEDESGWRHGGEKFSTLVDSLREEIQADLRKHSFYM